MAVEDLQTCFRHVSTYYSPKVYNRHYVLMYQEWYSRNFTGGVIAADGHFSVVGNLVSGVVVHQHYMYHRQKKVKDQITNILLCCQKLLVHAIER
jgi:hypothetical protein